MQVHQTSRKLAGFYLAILMIISLVFSGVIYQVSVTELERGLRRPTRILVEPGGFDFSAAILDRLNSERAAAYEQAKQRLLARLVIVNLLILIGGGMLSYYLAARTLRPIQEAHESLERFTADASHELRTPITTMRTENEVALMDPKLSLKQAKQQLQSNIEELQNLTTLAEGLLKLAHTDNTDLVRLPTPANNLVQTAVQRVSALASKHGIRIEPNKVPGLDVLVDEVSATEALVTLLDNAIKYSPDNSSVQVSVKQHQKMVQFIVKDSGAGIAPEALPHVFDRFYRADQSRTKGSVGGYGLGLAIAQNIAQTHGGSVKAHSKLGKGSTFTLAMPLLDSR